MKLLNIFSFCLLGMIVSALPQPQPATEDNISSPLERKNFEPIEGKAGSWSPAWSAPAAHDPFPAPIAKPGNVWGASGGGHEANPWQPSEPAKPAPSHPTWPEPSHPSQPPTWTTLPKPSHWQSEPPKTTEPAGIPGHPGKPTTTWSEPLSMTVPAGWEWGKHNGWKDDNGHGGKGGWKRSESVDGVVIEHLVGV